MLFPLINGNYFSWADVELTVSTPAPLIFAGVKAINYSGTLSKQKVRGTASVPIGVTKGKYEAQGDLELYLPAANLLITSLGPGWRQIPISIAVSYISTGPAGAPAPGLPQPVITDLIPGAFLANLEASQSESDEPLSRKFGLVIPGQILWNGLPSIIEPQTLLAIA